MDCHIPVIMIAGNHDSPERLGFGNRLLARQGLYVFGAPGTHLRPVVLEDETGPVCFIPLPYAEPALVREKFQTEELTDHHDALRHMVDYQLAQVPSGLRTVGIVHAFVAGGIASESERPLSVGGSGQVAPHIFNPFHYTALGHLHNAQTAGNERIRYAGSLLKYSFDEAAHQKGINIIDLDACGGVSIEQVSLVPRRDVRRICGLMSEILQAPQTGGDKEDYLLVTLEDREPILDVMGKLRQIYPNVLQVERTYLSAAGDLRKADLDYRQQSEAQLYGTFFRQVTGETLSQGQESRLTELLNEMFRQKREATG
jgi:exonuclease SbcD